MTHLQEKRKNKKLSQKMLAEQSGVHIGAIQHYETGFRDINKASAITLFHLAQVLGCSMESLLEIPEEGVDEVLVPRER